MIAQIVSLFNPSDTYQGDANNTNSGQASQQENRQASFGGSGHKQDCGCDGKCGKDGGTSGQSQRNSGRQSQLQILTASHQLSLQNLSIANSGDTYQGDANNTNSGQASQQENRQVSVGSGGVWTCGCDGSSGG